MHRAVITMLSPDTALPPGQSLHTLTSISLHTSLRMTTNKIITKSKSLNSTSLKYTILSSSLYYMDCLSTGYQLADHSELLFLNDHKGLQGVQAIVKQVHKIA